jgi:predicted amidohydrolase YtcJ
MRVRDAVSAGGWQRVQWQISWLGAIGVEQALRVMTINSAYALFRENEIGSLQAGKLGDLVILSENPVAIDPLAIKDIQVLVTMIDGKVEHCADGAEGLCPRA